MSVNNPLLIELFTEELPPKSLKALGESFQQTIVAGLVQKGLLNFSESSATKSSRSYATPRRLGVLVPNVASVGAPREIESKGPSVAVALDAQGQPTQALIKWAQKQGANIEQLVRAGEGKQECFYFRSTQPGQALGESIQGLIEQALQKLPIPKFMQYQLADGTTSVTFVRPAHSLLVMYGQSVLPCSVLGLSSNNVTKGHRFLGNHEISLAAASDYESALQKSKVLANFDQRKQQIRQSLLDTAKQLGARLSHQESVSDEAALDGVLEPYLDEVTALVEWPTPYVGQFEERFLAVPQECLILTMRTNQKYFPLFDQQGKLIPKFVIISNMQIDDATNIVAGNERVVRPRLADAQFFFQQDKKQTLAARIERLSSVVYHAKLGTQADRAKRVAALSRALVAALTGNQDPHHLVDSAQVERAAMLAKTDLLTDMVGEFPELQGLMGRYYALHDGEPVAIADAIAEHYQPRFSGDALPPSATGTVLALADKLETLAGIWGIGMQPSGDRDPFALRRHALGVIRMLIEKPLHLGLRPCLEIAFSVFSTAPNVKPDVEGLLSFTLDRLRGYLRDKGFEGNQIEAAFAVDSSDLSQLLPRLLAVKQFAQLPEAAALAAANKRIANLLKKQGPAASTSLNSALLSDDAEKQLVHAMDAMHSSYTEHLEQRRFGEALAALAALRQPVDRFFTEVMVMAEDPAVRANRLQLLSQLHQKMNRIADISLLDPASKEVRA